MRLLTRNEEHAPMWSVFMRNRNRGQVIRLERHHLFHLNEANHWWGGTSRFNIIFIHVWHLNATEVLKRKHKEVCPQGNTRQNKQELPKYTYAAHGPIKTFHTFFFTRILFEAALKLINKGDFEAHLEVKFQSQPLDSVPTNTQY